MKIKFVKYLQIGHNITCNVKSYLNHNTKYKDRYSNISHCIYEFRFIDGRRFVYKKPYEKVLNKEKMSDEIMNIIEPVKNFLNVVIISIEII